MINPIEYQLNSSDFKLLQFLKTVDKPLSIRELSNILNISDRTIKTSIKVLKEHNIIRSETVNITNQYFINEISLWDIKKETSRDKRAYELKIKAWEKEPFIFRREQC